MIINLEQVFLHGKLIEINDYSINISGDTLSRKDIKNCKANVSGVIRKVNHEVYLETNVNLNFDCLCDNCMELIHKVLNYSFKHLIINSNTKSDDINCISIVDYKLFLDSVVIEDIILEFPTKILCCDGCLGLCQKCGKNLNHGNCNCTKRSVDPRLEALEGLLD